MPLRAIRLVTLGIALLVGAAPAPAHAVCAPRPAAESGFATDSLPLAFVPAAGTPGSGGQGALREPTGIAVDLFGNLYVVDAGLLRLQRYDGTGHWLGEAGTLGSGPGELRAPVGVASLGSAGIALLDRENLRILAYDLYGRLTGTLVALDDPNLADAVGRVDPIALATDPGGAVYVADADRERLLVFDFAGTFVRTIGGFGDALGSFRGLSGVACGPRGEVYTAERAHRRVQRLDAGGQAAAWFTIPAVAQRGALALAVDDSMRVAVADERGGWLGLWDRNGRLLAARSGLKGPRAVAFARDGSLLVAESGAARILRFGLAARAPAAGRN